MVACGQMETDTVPHWSEYLQQLSGVSKKRYKEKVLLSGLKKDPYCTDLDWEKNPEILPKLALSDVMVYMISTPSPHTGEAVKVLNEEFLVQLFIVIL